MDRNSGAPETGSRHSASAVPGRGKHGAADGPGRQREGRARRLLQR